MNRASDRVYQDETKNADENILELQESVDYNKPYICNTADMLHKALDEGKSILLEGAQGTLLDVDHGTYPYVTSSNPTAGGACTGSGIHPMAVTQITGCY